MWESARTRMLMVMNGATDTNAGSDNTGTAKADQSGPRNFEDTVRDFWSSRPRRPRHGRKVAGVAAALGNRYDIDPIVIRVAFVVITFFGGIGPLLYVLGWLFLPEEHDEASGFENLIHRGRSSMSAGFAVLLCLLLIPLSGVAFSSGWLGRGNWFGGGGFIALILVCAGLYVLHRNRGSDNRPKPQPTNTPESVTTHTFPDGFSAKESALPTTVDKVTSEAPIQESVTISSEQPTEQILTPEWDPLGANPSAWEFPEPVTTPLAQTSPSGTNNPYTPVKPRPRKFRIGLLTFGAALLVAGVGIAIGIEQGGWFSIQHTLGLVLAVLGLGMVVGAFFRSGKGLIWLAVPLCMAGVAITAVPGANFSGGFGRIHATPLTVQEVQPLYQKSAGSIRLELTKLPNDAVVNTEIRNGVGESLVLVPETADVRFSCLNAAGPVRCLGHDSQGVGNGVIAGEDLGVDGAGGPQITVKITNGAGDVEVYRG